MPEELAKQYDPKKVEDRRYKEWIDRKYFHADPSSEKPPYSIVIPPPNVTGVLTMGHVLNNTLQDILCRRKRMQGCEVLWLPGTDHAGIATQTVVERMLKKDGKIKHREDLGREKFLEKVWEWKRRHGGIIIKQLKKLGCSCDWEREVFTMDGLDELNPTPRLNYSACVQKVFVDLYKKGLIYRGTRMVNWCPVSRTALSDEEVEMREVQGHLWYIKYPLIDEERFKRYKGGRMVNWSEAVADDYVVVATTRPETLLGDEAVAVNPKDRRYRNLIGRRLLLPLQNKPIPIIADPVVEMEFGTGAVKVTPAHDPTDYNIGIRHKLPFTEVIGDDGRMTALAGEKYDGLDRFECRKAVVFDLEEAGLLVKTEQYRHNVGFSQRADVPVEPKISEQWFLQYPSVKKSIKAVLDGKIKFWPDRWVKVYAHWMKNLRDWCISRQLWWGHRIPAWYCKAGSLKSGVLSPKSKTNPKSKDYNNACGIVVSIDKPKKCPKCGGTEFIQDPDVLDTWFSSWLWPFVTMGWPEKTDLLRKFYPTTDLVTGPDIIFFWVARMIMAGYEFMGEKPFENVYYTGIIRDAQGRKMSKSLGNSPDPLDLIDKYGADGLRFGLMLIAPKGQDILFSEERVEIGRNFMNKLWNASRFVVMNIPKTSSSLRKQGFNIPDEISAFTEMTNLSLADKWILNRLQHTINDVNKALDSYQFDTAARMIYQFVWGEYCDWYLEMAKTQLARHQTCVDNPTGCPQGSDSATLSVLVYVLDNIVRLLHPYAPFITEEIWQLVARDSCLVSYGALRRAASDEKPFDFAYSRQATIMYASYPAPSKKIPFETEAAEMEIAMEVVRAIRNIRGEHNVPPAKKIAVVLFARGVKVSKILEEKRMYIQDLAKVEKLSINPDEAPPKESATAVAGEVEVFVPFAGIIDAEAERERLIKEIKKVKSYVVRLEGKLANDNFVKKAPKNVVEGEKARLLDAEAELRKLNAALRKLS